MTNADKIRQMNDEQLARFLWIWKINSVTTFFTQGGMNSMDAKDMHEWVGQTTETFVCTETFVGDDYIFDQDFNDKADRKTENSSEIPNNCETCRFELYCPEMCDGCCEWDSHYQPKDETQTDIHDLTDCDFCKDRNCKDCEGGKDEPQTEQKWTCARCGFENNADFIWCFKCGYHKTERSE